MHVLTSFCYKHHLKGRVEERPLDILANLNFVKTAHILHAGLSTCAKHRPLCISSVFPFIFQDITYAKTTAFADSILRALFDKR